jgi:hypothetical protein
MHTPYRDGSFSPLFVNVSSQGGVQALDRPWIHVEEKLDFGCFVPAFLAPVWPKSPENHGFQPISVEMISFRLGSSLAWKLAYSKLSLPRLGWLSTFRPAMLLLTSWVPHQASNSGQPWRSLASRSTKAGSR